jgi:hypothetical protein
MTFVQQNKKEILLFLIGILLIVIGVLIYKDNSYKILVITNYRENTNYYKYVLNAEEKIKKSYTDIKIIWNNIDYAKRTNKNYIDIKKKELKDILKNNKIIGVVLGSTSGIADAFLDIIPPDMPVIAEATSPYALSKFKGKNIFTVAPIPLYSRAKYIENLKKMLSLKNIVFILDNNAPFSKTIYISLKIHYPLHLYMIKKNDFIAKRKTILKQYPINNTLYVTGIDSSYVSLDFIKKYLNIQNINIFVLYSTINKKLYKNINKKVNIYSITLHNGTFLNFFKYKFLPSPDYFNWNLYFMDRYASVYKTYNYRINLLLSKYLKKNNNLHTIRKNIIKNLQKLKYPDNIFIDKNMKYLLTFEKILPKTFEINKTYPVMYYNSIYKTKIGLRNKYICKLKDGKKQLYPIQYIYIDNNKQTLVPVVTASITFNNIEITDLSAEKAYIDIYLTLSYLNDKKFDISYWKDLKIASVKKLADKQEYSLVKTYIIKNKIFKIYRIKMFVPVKNNLFTFPFDKFWLNLEFVKDNYKARPYVLRISTPNNMLEKKHFSEIKILHYFPTYYEKIVFLDNIPHIITNKSLLIQMKRTNTSSIIIKYLLPAVIIMLIGVYIGYLIIRHNIEHDSKGIVSDTILGVISVYFVFSLLISIKDLTIMDIVFYVMIFILSLLLIYIFYKFKKQKYKRI